jgi:DNA repair exonuclease SbcCD ATPase subunit
VKLAYVDLCGFRGYHKRLRIEFPDGFTVIDGRNGVGKSTIFDAVEFGGRQLWTSSARLVEPNFSVRD